ncbi:MAG TPA: LysR substrate-binding domain-containing protein [Rubrivivax sp.]|nr:LysR substrate-binding domain-containing protein [Rubrivivax sp.]
MNITFRQLQVFAEVAQHGSMARAAESLHLTPPAVSMQIKELETQLRLPLFDRQGRKVSLSTAGEYFLVHAKRLLAALKDADDAMARLKKLEHGLLTIGLVSTAKYFVPHLLARFREEHPGVDVRLRVVGNRGQLVELMQSGDVDLSVMGRPPKEISTRSESFAAHPLVFVAPPGHPLLVAGPHSVRALAPYAIIAREHGSGTRTAMEKFFAEQRFEPRIAMEMSSNETIKQAVMAGLGLSFLSLHTMGLELRSGLLHLLDIEGAPVMRMWNVVHLASKLLSPAAEAFRYFIIEQGEAHLRAHDAPLIGSGH